MTEKEFLKIYEFYNLTSRLKTLLRKGWVDLKLENDRFESDAEHIFGTCMLALAIQSVTKQKLDMNKVFLMLILHETEEILIGDITLDDVEMRKTKREDGKKAVKKIFSALDDVQNYLDVIEEFEQNVTPEAKFSKMIDRFESDMQATNYRNHFNISEIVPEKLNSERMIELRNNGYDTIGEIFLQNHIGCYEGSFLEMAQHLSKIQKKIKNMNQNNN